MSMIFEAADDRNAFDLMSEYVGSFLKNLGFSDATLLLKLSDPYFDDSILLESCWLEDDMIIFNSDFWEGQITIELFAIIDDAGFYAFGYDFEEKLLHTFAKDLQLIDYLVAETDLIRLMKQEQRGDITMYQFRKELRKILKEFAGDDRYDI